MVNTEPLYIKAVLSGLLKRNSRKAHQLLKPCTLCPRGCGVDRLASRLGVCRTGERAVVAGYEAHFGEEDSLVGNHGSGAIFFSNCNLLCSFCQNYEISHKGQGETVTSEELSRIMLLLQEKGCHNINLVTPSHVVPQILSALELSVAQGLRIPLVYNTSAYDRIETLQLLDGIIDIYMPDFKFWDPAWALTTCNTEDYPDVARSAIIEMYRQVGDLLIDGESGLAYRGLLVRHLVMPFGIAGTSDIMGFIAKEISANTYVNIMPQYRPCGQAKEIQALDTTLSKTEFESALKTASNAGLSRLDQPARRFIIW